MAGRLFCVGSYTQGNGDARPGITVLRENARSGVPDRVQELDLPDCSWLAWHPRLPVVYAVHERAEGTVTAVELSADGTRATVLGTVPTGGAEPCHLVVTPDARHLLAANYGSGSAAVIALDDRGAPTVRTDLAEHSGSGPVADRQEGPHAHMVTLDAAGTLVTVTDLGSDTLWSYRLSPAGTMERVAAGPLPAGTGPRQLIRPGAGSRAYVVAELAAGLLTVTEETPGVFSVLGSAPASRRPDANMPAQFSLSPDGRFGFLSNRGPDTISVFDLTGGSAVPVAEYALNAAWPRHFAVTDDRLYVAAQQADAVVVLTLDPATGVLRESHRLTVAAPACVAPEPLRA
ncbi:lactonase family protein [Streptomyces johnsoniae]|uniref:Beta-propeller fold lactonase family protein n=1 Tax=Streptomyces johnsoniae TaxID=3075532 RepID=A0ABU2S0Z9_9ACTN|nr:beta-propeller fold lactonase family protein [Streptomyces sp. DSM 41886]MDT0442678.1 beta-propeller fold lactonase family protein [Streptomyces sp. DSM 41886]